MQLLFVSRETRLESFHRVTAGLGAFGGTSVIPRKGPDPSQFMICAENLWLPPLMEIVIK